MKNRATPPISFLQHAHALFDNPPSTERDLEIYIANNTPGPDEINIDRAMKLGLFLREYCGVIDLAMQDSQASPKAQEMLATCLDNLAYEYVTEKDTARSLKLLRGIINRFYHSTSLPLVFVWQKLCCRFFGGVPAIIPGVTEAQVMAAMSRRYERYNKGAGFVNTQISQPENEEKEEDMSKFEEMLAEIASDVKSLTTVIKSVSARVDALEEAKQTKSDVKSLATVIKSVSARVDALEEEKSNVTPTPTPMQPVPTGVPTVQPIFVCPPKDKHAIEREKYQVAVEEFRKEFFDGKFDLSGAIEKLQTSVGSIDMDKFTKTAVSMYCKADPVADMQQVFKLIFFVEAAPSDVATAVKETIAAGLADDLKNAVFGFVHRDRAVAFNKSESLRNHPSEAVKKLGLTLMGW